MQTLTGTGSRTVRRQPRLAYRMARASGRALLYCAALLPVGTAALLAAPLGRAGTAAGWWRSLRVGLLKAAPVGSRRTPGPVAVAGHAVLSLLVGAAALVPLGVEILVVFRGALYGVVDPGPYTTAWGGPTRGGAWLAHFLIGLPFAAAGLLVLAGIAAVHQRLTRGLDGGRTTPWLIPVALLICLAGGLVLFAWTRQFAA